MRVQDWPQRLDAYIAECGKKTFTWGEWDCCMFAADVVREMTGVDYAGVLRGAYTDREGANAVVSDHGSLQAFITSLLGEPVHPSVALRGDVVLAMIKIGDGTEVGECLGICLGAHCAFPKARGLKFERTLTVRCAWRIE